MSLALAGRFLTTEPLGKKDCWVHIGSFKFGRTVTQWWYSRWESHTSESILIVFLLLLLLSRFSRVRLCVAPETAAHQAPLSLGFSRQEHWSGLPFPSPMRESGVIQSCLTLSNPMDCSLQGFSIHGIFKARVMEWGAIAFSELYC